MISLYVIWIILHIIIMRIKKGGNTPHHLLMLASISLEISAYQTMMMLSTLQSIRINSRLD